MPGNLDSPCSAETGRICWMPTGEDEAAWPRIVERVDSEKILQPIAVGASEPDDRIHEAASGRFVVHNRKVSRVWCRNPIEVHQVARE